MRPARARAKLTMAVGILTMLSGAMFVLAPGAGAQAEHRVTICHRTNSVTAPYVRITVDYDGADGSIERGRDHHDHAGPVFDFDADPAVAYPKPRNGAQWGDIIPPVALDGGGKTDGLNWDQGETIWDQGCRAPEVDPTTLRIVKVVAGDQPVVPTDWSFPFTGLAGGFDLTDEAPSSDAEIIDAGTPYTVTETDAKGASATTFDCVGALVWSALDGAATDISVTVAEGEDAVCTFTNTYTQQTIPPCIDDPNTPGDDCKPRGPRSDPASLTIVKAVDAAGDDPAPDDWSFAFDAAGLRTFHLTDEDPDHEFTDLPDGDYTVTEVSAGDADLTDVACSAGAEEVEATIADDGSTGSVTVDLDAGDTVICTFTNTYPEVEPTVVVVPPRETVNPPRETVNPPRETVNPPRETKPPPEMKKPPPERPRPRLENAPEGSQVDVLGEQAMRTLPRTGGTNGQLAVLGVALLLVGTAMVGGSRLRLRHAD